MKVNLINANTPLNGVSAGAVQNSAQILGHANSSPAFKGKVLEIKSEKLINNLGKMGDGFPSWAQRLVSGVTGIMLQPWFDLNNKNVDEDTRRVSWARTIGKIIAGTLTGVAIRWGCVKATENFTRSKTAEKELKDLGKLPKKLIGKPMKKWSQALLPETAKTASFKEIRKYRGALGTYAGLFVMIFTNFLVDAPLTTHITNKILKHYNLNSTEKKKTEGGKS